jgi:homoserine O-acetyltransferase|tara:strand:+ start:1349 stop:2551 length:1203 start_codon:yes stop_codon:yes gene_type:complete
MDITRKTVELGKFEFACGDSINNLVLAYETYGEFTGENAVLICHALTGSAHVAGQHNRNDTNGQARAWWDSIVGHGKPIDTSEYYVICINAIGSCYGSSGPSSTSPETNLPYGTNFPPVTITDWTRSQRMLLDHIGVGRLHAVIGGSVGGMNVLEWGKLYPDDVNRLIPIATSSRLDPQCVALDSIACSSITGDPNWNGGDYYDSIPPLNGLSTARKIGHVMYLSKQSMSAKFGRRSAGRDSLYDFSPTDPAAAFFPYTEVQSYLDYNSEKFTTRFDPNSYLYLVRAMDNYDLSSGYESDTDALSAFTGEVLILSFLGDWHFTSKSSEDLANSFRKANINVRHHVVDSTYGHDAFLVEPNYVGPPISGFLSDGINASSVTDTFSKPTHKFAPVHNSLFSN